MNFVNIASNARLECGKRAPTFPPARLVANVAPPQRFFLRPLLPA